ncbi:MAG: sulfurtransferase TusA family protein [Aeromonadales bacterium]|nr:sulfurtransferase TusA family protein [Aeromonadales bacterium]
METLDARGWRCPMPLLKVKLWLKSAAAGQQLRLTIDDAGSRQDIPNYLANTAQPFQVVEDHDTHLILVLAKSPKE